MVLQNHTMCYQVKIYHLLGGLFIKYLRGLNKVSLYLKVVIERRYLKKQNHLYQDLQGLIFKGNYQQKNIK
ncbi:unnamed protein product [Paramecium primaurelia]|uniref:Uncharacterized protein n=1 Tax=Paramecium primaurelia TaxID=5886 RepID=A0A8S1NCE6_PARPR|nr:unnamed protein product [Paramecium primaurelia]